MRWEYINITKADNMLMSGWKLYIYGNTVEDGRYAYYLLYNFIRDLDITAKIASPSIIKRNLNTDRAWAPMVIYLDPYCVKNIDRILKVFISYLKIGKYWPKGYISGALDIHEGLIHLRYDLEIPVNPVIGVDYDTYLANYRGEYGEYNIPGNQTLIP